GDREVGDGQRHAGILPVPGRPRKLRGPVTGVPSGPGARARPQPALKKNRDGADKRSRITGSEAMNRRVLLVDDEPVVLESLRRQLAGTFEVETAPGPREGLERVRSSEPYAAVVSDMR